MEVEEYARVAAAESGHWWYIATRRLIADALGDAQGPRVLDAGCGPGGNGAWLRERGEVFGFDLSTEALRYAQRNHPTLSLARASLEAVPYADASFGIVVAVTVISQLDDGAAAIAELTRVTRPGGTVLVIEPAFELFRRSHDRVVHVHRRYRRPELVAAFAAAGLTVTRATYAHSYLTVPAAVLSAADRLRRRRAREVLRSDVERESVPMVWKSLARLERATLRRVDLPVGLSVLVAGRKPGTQPAEPDPPASA